MNNLRNIMLVVLWGSYAYAWHNGFVEPGLSFLLTLYILVTLVILIISPKVD